MAPAANGSATYDVDASRNFSFIFSPPAATAQVIRMTDATGATPHRSHHRAHHPRRRPHARRGVLARLRLHRQHRPHQELHHPDADVLTFQGGGACTFGTQTLEGIAIYDSDPAHLRGVALVDTGTRVALFSPARADPAARGAPRPWWARAGYNGGWSVSPGHPDAFPHAVPFLALSFCRVRRPPSPPAPLPSARSGHRARLICIMQRYALAVCGVIGLVAGLHNPRHGGQNGYAALLAVAALQVGASRPGSRDPVVPAGGVRMRAGDTLESFPALVAADDLQALATARWWTDLPPPHHRQLVLPGLRRHPRQPGHHLLRQEIRLLNHAPPRARRTSAVQFRPPAAPAGSLKAPPSGFFDGTIAAMRNPSNVGRWQSFAAPPAT